MQQKNSGRKVKHGNKVHSNTGPDVSHDERPCTQCRYLRKLLLNQAPCKPRQARMALAPRTKQVVQHSSQLQLCREKAKVTKLKEVLAQIKQDKAAISTSSLEKSLCGLPQKQRHQVETCFKTSKRKGTQGMTYNREWVLACILMKIKSTKLYDHVRKYKIMVLPSQRLPPEICERL